MAENNPFLSKRIGNYIITEVLGEGAMGTVYLAEHPDIGQKVAIKILEPRFSDHPELSQRFLIEARSIARINHPNVISLFDFGRTEEGHLYYVMEHLKGIDIRQIINLRGAMPPQEVRPYLEQICDGLQAAHDHGVIHRDLKPEHIIVLGEVKRLMIKIIDFGLAKLNELEYKELSRTVRGIVMGTPSTISPEQAAGQTEKICPQTDIYALGVVLYWMLAGRPPFEHPTVAVVIAKHITDQPPSLKELVPSLPSEAVELVHRCLAKAPQERPESAAAVSEAFNAIVRSLSGSNPLETMGSGEMALKRLRGSASTLKANREAEQSQELPNSHVLSTAQPESIRPPPMLPISPEEELDAKTQPPQNHPLLAPPRGDDFTQDGRFSNAEELVLRKNENSFTSESGMLDALISRATDNSPPNGSKGFDELETGEAMKAKGTEAPLEASSLEALLAMQKPGASESSLLQGGEGGAGPTGTGESSQLQGSEARSALAGNAEPEQRQDDAFVSGPTLSAVLDHAVIALPKNKTRVGKWLAYGFSFLGAAIMMIGLLFALRGERKADTPELHAPAKHEGPREKDQQQIISLAHIDSLPRLREELNQLLQTSRSTDLEHLELAVKAKGKPRAHLLLGRIFLLGGQVGRAKLQAEAAGADPEAKLLSAEVKHSSGHPAIALRAYKKLVAFELVKARALLRKGEAHAALGEIDQAQLAYQKALAADVRLAAPIHMKLGELREQQDHYSKAIAEYKKAISIDGKYVEARIALGFTLARLRLYHKAKKELDAALKLAPDNPMAYYYLGTVMYNLQKPAKAISAYRRALKAKPRFAEAHYQLGQIYFEEGDKIQAKEQFQAAIEDNSQYAPAIHALNNLK